MIKGITENGPKDDPNWSESELTNQASKCFIGESVDYAQKEVLGAHVPETSTLNTPSHRHEYDRELVAEFQCSGFSWSSLPIKEWVNNIIGQRLKKTWKPS